MEVELKYRIPDEDTADWIWSDEDLGRMIEEDSWSVDRYYGSYYDTRDMILSKHDITFRLRHEGDFVVACLKWNGTGEGALQRREELNITLGTEMPEEADPSVFSQHEVGKRIIDAIGDEKLIPMIDVSVLRKSMRVDTGSSILEISIDQGKVTAGGSEEPISEVEIELYQGDEEDLMEIGNQLSGKYGLEPETESKFARGLKLLNTVNN